MPTHGRSVLPVAFISHNSVECARSAALGAQAGFVAAPDNGEVNWVEIEIPTDGRDHDHEISDEERIRAALIVE